VAGWNNCIIMTINQGTTQLLGNERRKEDDSMSLSPQLFGKKEDYKCTSCYALILESTFTKNNGLCALCACSQEMATNRHSWMESHKAKFGEDRACAKCGRAELSLHRDTIAAKRKGMFIYCEDWPGLLYCDHCENFFCSSCQIELGISLGCPICRQEIG